MRLSRSRPWLAPLALIVGAFAMLFDGVKLLLTNWRLTLIQVLPAMWIWAAMLDLKAHVLHGKSFHVLTGPTIVIPIVIAVAAVTAASFYLNAVFAFAIVQPGRPQIRPAFTQARSHLPVVLGSGGVVGILLGLSTVVVVRWGVFWFGFSLSIVVGVMMICYVAVPSRLIGMKTDQSETRQAGRHRGGRGYRGDDMHSSLCPGPRRAAYARIARALHLHSRRHPVRRRANVAGRRDGGG